MAQQTSDVVSASGDGCPDESPLVAKLTVDAYRVTTDEPEADGTLGWDSTTIVVVRAHCGEEVGLGYTYADGSTATLIESKLAGVVCGRDALSPRSAWTAMRRAVRNLGHPGISAMAISAVDLALWDLQARLLSVSLCTLLGRARDYVPIYGSGGFTTYSDARLSEQLGGWAASGIPRVKMKVGSEPGRDLHRAQVARQAIGADAELFVDANGAYTRKQALLFAERFVETAGVSWFEEPVSSDDLDGLRLLRDRAPAGMPIAAGEYGYEDVYFRRMLEAQAVDVLQADVTRCGGITGFLDVAALSRAHQLPLSAHCGPAIHLHVCCAVENLAHLEYFHDHVRIENLLFDGVVEPRDGALAPDLGRWGNGLALREADAESYRL